MSTSPTARRRTGSPRPELILQFAQRRRGLEDARLPERHRVVLRAGTCVIAGVDGTVEYLVPKPLLRSRPPDGGSGAGRRFHDEGQRRLEAIRGWLGQLDDGDPLTAWMLQPASKRLTFANLHAGRTARGGDG